MLQLHQEGSEQPENVVQGSTFDTLANYFGANPCLGRICRFTFETSRSTNTTRVFEE